MQGFGNNARLLPRRQRADRRTRGCKVSATTPGCFPAVSARIAGPADARFRKQRPVASPRSARALFPELSHAVSGEVARCFRSCGVGLGILVLVVAALLGCAAISAADSASVVEARIKAAFIYNFARFIEWPPGSAQGPLRIGIQGRGDLVSPLEVVIRGKTANGRSIEMVRVSTASEAEHCEILLIERSEAGGVREIAQTLAGKPVLTVCDGDNCLRDGAMIAFRVVDDSVRFQINQEAAEHSGLKISSQLLKVALPGGKRP